MFRSWCHAYLDTFKQAPPHTALLQARETQIKTAWKPAQVQVQRVSRPNQHKTWSWDLRELVISTNRGWARASGSRKSTGKGLVAVNAGHEQSAARRLAWPSWLGPGELRVKSGNLRGRTYSPMEAPVLRLCGFHQLSPSWERSKLAWHLTGLERNKTRTG